MSLQEIIAGGGCLIVLMTLVQVSPIKIDPWSAIGKVFSAIGRSVGNALNGSVIEKLDKMEAMQTQTRQRLDEHIRVDDERNADMHRASILAFNAELRRGVQHNEEDFNEVLYNIDCYERYCKEHPEYPNSRAVHAIGHIKGLYDVHMDQNDFCE